MKTKTTKIFIYTLAFATILLFNSCSKTGLNDHSPCHTVGDVYCYLRSDDLVKIPYKLNDTIKLQYNGSGSTIYYFIQQKIDTGFNLFQTLNGDCPGDRQHWQYINYNYTCSLYLTPLIITQYLNGCTGSNTSVIFDKQEFTVYTADIGSPYYYNNLNINGKSYTNIVKLIQASIYGDTNYYALYNTSYGVLQIVSNGKLWYRAPQ